MSRSKDQVSSPALSIEQFFAGEPDARRLFDAVAKTVASVGPAQVRVSKSQIAFRRKRSFAFAWRPEQYLRGKHAPLVLSVAMRRRAPSTRWKEIVEPRPGWFMHHLELRRVQELDAEVRAWLQQAWADAG